MKLITIDFWNTIFDSSNGEARNNFRISELKANIDSLAPEISIDDYNRAMKDSWEYFNNIWRNQQRTPSSNETINYFWQHLNLPLDVDAMNNVRKAFEESVLYYPPNLIEGVQESLATLSSHFTLALISDTGFSPGSVLKRLMYENDILSHFTAFSFSDETGVAKPHPRAYHSIFEQTGFTAFQSCHIGDIEDTDIAGAKSLGMHAIRFSGDSTAFLSTDNPKESKADLQSDYWHEITDYLINKRT